MLIITFKSFIATDTFRHPIPRKDKFVGFWGFRFLSLLFIYILIEKKALLLTKKIWLFLTSFVCKYLVFATAAKHKTTINCKNKFIFTLRPFLAYCSFGVVQNRELNAKCKFCWYNQIVWGRWYGLQRVFINWIGFCFVWAFVLG